MRSFFATSPVNAIVEGNCELVTEGVEWVVLSEHHVLHYGPWTAERGWQARAFAASLGGTAQALRVAPFWYCPKVGKLSEWEAKKALAAYAAARPAAEVL